MESCRLKAKKRNTTTKQIWNLISSHIGKKKKSAIKVSLRKLENWHMDYLLDKLFNIYKILVF